MSESDKNTPSDSAPSGRQDNANGRDNNKLGISRGLYATGVSVKDGLIAFVLITAALIAGIAFGKARELKTLEPNIFGKVARTIDGWHKDIKELFGKQFAKFAGKNQDKLPQVTGAEVGASVVAATVLSHVIQVPGFHRGWKDAQKANDKYDALVKEKETLVVANARLIEENNKFRSTLEKKSGSFTERAAAEPEASSAGVSATR